MSVPVLGRQGISGLKSYGVGTSAAITFISKLIGGLPKPHAHAYLNATATLRKMQRPKNVAREQEGQIRKWGNFVT